MLFPILRKELFKEGTFDKITDKNQDTSDSDESIKKRLQYNKKHPDNDLDSSFEKNFQEFNYDLKLKVKNKKHSKNNSQRTSTPTRQSPISDPESINLDCDEDIQSDLLEKLKLPKNKKAFENEDINLSSSNDSLNSIDNKHIFSSNMATGLDLLKETSIQNFSGETNYRAEDFMNYINNRFMAMYGSIPLESAKKTQFNSKKIGFFASSLIGLASEWFNRIDNPTRYDFDDIRS